MNTKIHFKIISLSTILLWFTLSLSAEIRLPSLISDGMVLQRDIQLRIWGWASPGEQVVVKFRDLKATTITDDDGRWEVKLGPLAPGGPFKMDISGTNAISLQNILVGDVWLCSGQSNMELNLRRVEPMYPDEIAQSENPEVRYFQTPKKFNFKGPQNDLEGGEWQMINPETAPGIAAVPYFFSKELNKHLKVPIGIINSSLGGSPINSWMSEEALQEFPDALEEGLRFRSDSLIDAIRESDRKRNSEWYQNSWFNDRGFHDTEIPWYSPELDDSSWDDIQVPGFWKSGPLKGVNGVVWYRKTINIPKEMTGKKGKINLGVIVDADSVFINGKHVGNTGYQYPPRRYMIPADLLHEGENSIVVRVISNIGIGGFVKKKPYEIVVGDKKVDLKGTWKYKIGVEMDPQMPQTFIRWKPMGLYNAMIAPLKDYSFKGVVWYQGESDTGHPALYAKMLTSMIADWRTKLGREDLPFLLVQLPNFMKAKDAPEESNWAEFRQVQLDALTIPNTGMAVTIDVGEWNDIHPLNKEDVGKRLARVARKVAYGEQDIVYSGPLYKDMKKDGEKIVLSFDCTGSGLVSSDGKELGHFAIAGTDGKFVWARAKISGNEVVVWSDQVKDPVAVRYAWADNPEGANLSNKEGLPASPFTTEKQIFR